MIPIGQLRHHPQNPRTDLGDLTELTASIREQGILQNLTVTPMTKVSADNSASDGLYWVVIGNRRFEASKAAGLKELPCTVVQMDLKTAMRTMMSENMQRSDLTVLDQIKGIGYMQQLGMSLPEIAQGTGLSETTVRNRAKVSKLPKKELELACDKGATLLDLLEVTQLKAGKQKEVLKEFGTNNFRYMLNSAKRNQEKAEWEATILPRILAKYPKIGEVPNGESYSAKWRMVCRWDNRSEMKPVPDPKPGMHYALKKFDFAIELMMEDPHWKKEKAEEKERTAWMKERRATAKALNREAFELRAGFIRRFSPRTAAEVTKFHKLLLDRALLWKGLTYGVGYYHSWDQGVMRKILAIPYEEDRDRNETFEHELARRGVNKNAALLAWACCGGIALYCREDDGWISDYNAIWKPCEELEEQYSLLEALGYQMSDFEKSLRDKSHEFFREEK